MLICQETERKWQECVQRHGTTPAAYLDSLGLFEHGGGGYHCIWFTDEEIELFLRKGLTAVTNPGSNTKLASGIANTTAFLKHGVNMAIGTDGPASNNCLDMFREMFLVTGLGKLHDRDASAVPAEEVLKMAVTGGAKAMGLTDCELPCRRQKGGSDYDRSEPAEYATYQQPDEKPGIQRKQTECEDDHDQRQDPL